MIGLLFWVIAKLPNYSTGYNSWVREILDKEFYQVYDDSVLGKIYHSKTFYMPFDSLAEYYWDDNYILVGNNKISELNRETYLKKSFEDEKDVEKTISLVRILNNENNKEDSLTIIRKNFVIDGNVLSIISLNCDLRIIYLFGEDYSIEESYRLGSIMYYGEVRNKIIEYLPTISQPVDQKANTPDT